jgi:hypothetical protein
MLRAIDIFLLNISCYGLLSPCFFLHKLETYPRGSLFPLNAAGYLHPAHAQFVCAQIDNRAAINFIINLASETFFSSNHSDISWEESGVLQLSGACPLKAVQETQIENFFNPKVKSRDDYIHNKLRELQTFCGF